MASDKLIITNGNHIILRPSKDTPFQESLYLVKAYGWGEPAELLVQNKLEHSWDLVENAQPNEETLAYFVGVSTEQTLESLSKRVIPTMRHAYAVLFAETGWGPILANEALVRLQESMHSPSLVIKDGAVTTVEISEETVYVDIISAHINQQNLLDENKAFWKSLYDVYLKARK